MEKPNILILSGPFLDENNIIFQNGECKNEKNEFIDFEEQLRALLIGIRDTVKYYPIQ